MELFVLAQSSGEAAGVMVAAAIGLCVGLIPAIAMIAGMWKMFEKAGKPGWAAIVPIYNTWILVEISSKETLWFFLLLIPLVNIVISILLLLDLAEQFGKGTGFAVGMILLPVVFIPLLGFGDAQYLGGHGGGAGF